jgi:hypothetical protein
MAKLASAFVAMLRTGSIVILSLSIMARMSNAAEPSEPPGYLVISLGPAQHDVPVGLFLDYASDDRKTSDEVSWRSLWPTPNDYENDNGDRGIVYVEALPPDSYHLNRIAENDANFVYWWGVSVPFAIVSGHVTYAGDFKFVNAYWSGWFGVSVPKGGYVKVANESARDVPIAAKKTKVPELATLPLDLLIVDAAALGAPPFCMAPNSEGAPHGTDYPTCAVAIAK